MAKPTKNQVIASLNALGVVVDPETKYDDLVKQLGDLQPADEEEPRLAPSEEKEEPRLVSPEQSLSSNETNEDYLRKYQYRNQTNLGSSESDPPSGSKAETMKKFLLSQPRVRMFIPRVNGEDKSVPQSVTLNGYRLDFPKQAYVDVPEAVATVLMESLQQTEAAVQRLRIDGDKRKENALL